MTLSDDIQTRKINPTNSFNDYKQIIQQLTDSLITENSSDLGTQENKIIAPNKTTRMYNNKTLKAMPVLCV